MPESGKTDRTSWHPEYTRHGGSYVNEHFGEVKTKLVFAAGSKSEAGRVADLLQGAYQRGREELMKELAALAVQPGGIIAIVDMLTEPNPDAD